MDQNIVIEVKNVSMHFNMAAERIETLKEYVVKGIKGQLFYKDFIAVDNVSFKIAKGEVFGIVGTNGSGKSTLLKMISGILAPTKGTISIKGTVAPLIELGAGFDGELTARENIFLNGAILGYERSFIEEKFNSIVDFAELWEFLDMPIKNYSSGMVARIAFAIATVVKPDILIVDEILAVGDFLFQQKCERRIRELMEDGTTVLIVSHNIDQIESLCNRVLWIEKSVPKMLGTAFEVCNSYRNLQNQGKQSEQIEYQIVAHEKCHICGNEVDFRDEPGMTYKGEAFCPYCGTTVRVSDMMNAYLERICDMTDSSLVENKVFFKDKKIFTSSNTGALSGFFSQFDNYTSMQGNFAERCRKLESEAFFEQLPYDFDLICMEELLICVNNAREILKKLSEHLKPDGVMLVTLQLYENEKTELNKKIRHSIYWNGVPIVNKWGGKDISDVFKQSGLYVQMVQGHKWYESHEIIKFGTQYEKLIITHPFYFYKFNTWVMVAQRLNNDKE